MNNIWQNLASLAIVALAAAYVARQIWSTFASRKRGCGHCVSCPSEKAAAGPAVVSLDTLSRPKKTG